MKLELFFPVKPYNVTQAFGIFNPAYLQFGYSKHNGIDFAVDTDGIVCAMCDGEVYQTGFSPSAGNYVRYKTGITTAENRTGVVGFMCMHAKEILVKAGDRVKAGTPLLIAGNTGFSTGPHTHISAYFINELEEKISLGSPETDNCFDFSKYYNGYYADDATQVFSIYLNVIKLLKDFLRL